MSLASNLCIRAEKLAQVRTFFAARGVLEVDTHLLSDSAPVDTHIDIFETTCGHFLHSSPEYAMKKLLSAGAPDIYQLGHVYRKGEVGAHHHPIFTMLEWYRLQRTFEGLIEETLDLLALFIDGPVKQHTYDEALQLYGKNLTGDLHHDWAFCVEPNMDLNAITVITDFPGSEAALAKIENGKARRFEVYHRGVELANGYDELTDPDELLKRFEHANLERDNPLPIDYALLESMKNLPPCVGVAVGFDRCMMLHQNLERLPTTTPAQSGRHAPHQTIS